MFLSCSNGGGTGYVNGPVNLMKDEFGIYSKSNKGIVETLSNGDTLSVLKWGYGKDYVYFKVEYNKKKGFVYLNDPITFTGTSCPHAK